MLEQLFSRSDLSPTLLSRSDWHPFPTAAERRPWESLPDPIRSALVNSGERALEAEWPALPATLFLDYARTGSRSNYERPRFRRRGILADLVLAYCAQPADKYLDPIVDAIWSICEESSWAVPAHLSRAQRAGEGLPDTAEPVVDLFAAETGAALAWCLYLLDPAPDRASPLLRPRIEREVRMRVLQPCFDRDFHWMKMLNNWNPWINSNRLTCALLLEDDDERRLRHVTESIKSIDVFLATHPRDGGCDEGPGYWGRAAASLFDSLELLTSATGGAFDACRQPLVAEMGRYIYRVHIADSWFVNFADAPAICIPDAALVHGYGKRIGDRLMQEFGAYLAELSARKRAGGVRGTSRQSIGRRLRDVFSSGDLAHTAPRPPLLRDVWLPDTQVMVARSAGGSTDGLFLAAKGGHNAESHNHNDVGQFVVFENARPLLIDAGVEGYRRETFSSRRYEIWTMQSCFHNLPAINGQTQAAGEAHRARDVSCAVDDSSAALTMDIAPAYPAGAGILSWQRTLSLRRGQRDVVEVADEWKLEQKPESLLLALLTPSDADMTRKGEIVLKGRPLSEERSSGSGRLRFDPEIFDIKIETIPIDDARLARVWGGRISRILLQVTAAGASGGCRLEIDNR